jgi:hypothetical protein
MEQIQSQRNSDVGRRWYDIYNKCNVYNKWNVYIK